jgi:dTDP-glucose 4,6-dehydratase
MAGSVAGDRMSIEIGGARVVVLGAAGFIGSNLVDSLLAGGASVIGVDNMDTGSPRNLTHVSEDAPFTFVRHDIVDPFDIDGSVDVVVNLASPASPPDYFDMPIETLRVGSRGTENALELALRKGSRIVFASTSEVYGDPLVHPQPEDYWGNVNPVGPRAVYDESKRYAEALTMAYRRERGVDTGIVRIFNTYGPRMRIDDGRAVPEFFRAAIEGRPLRVHGDGNQTRSMCYVDDLVAGLVAMIVSDEPGPVNLGNSHEISVNELAEAVQRSLGVSTGIEYVGRLVDDPNRRCPDTTLALERLGWEATVPLSDGLARTALWFLSQSRGDDRDRSPGTASVPARATLRLPT